MKNTISKKNMDIENIYNKLSRKQKTTFNKELKDCIDKIKQIKHNMNQSNLHAKQVAIKSLVQHADNKKFIKRNMITTIKDNKKSSIKSIKYEVARATNTMDHIATGAMTGVVGFLVIYLLFTFFSTSTLILGAALTGSMYFISAAKMDRVIDKYVDEDKVNTSF